MLKLKIMLLIAAAVVLGPALAADPSSSLKCKPYYGLSELANQVVENGFCLADAGRTCCSARDAQKIRTDIEIVR